MKWHFQWSLISTIKPCSLVKVWLTWLSVNGCKNYCSPENFSVNDTLYYLPLERVPCLKWKFNPWIRIFSFVVLEKLTALRKPWRINRWSHGTVSWNSTFPLCTIYIKKTENVWRAWVAKHLLKSFGMSHKHFEAFPNSLIVLIYQSFYHLIYQSFPPQDLCLFKHIQTLFILSSVCFLGSEVLRQKCACTSSKSIVEEHDK